jgi:hypothetical protein
MASALKVTEIGGLNANNLPKLSGEQALELQRSNYTAFTPTLNEVHRALSGLRVNRGKDAHVYLVNGRVLGLMLK